MKKRVLFIFIAVLLINMFFAILLTKTRLVSQKDTVFLLLVSYVVYWIFNLYLYIQIKIKNISGYYFSLIIGIVVCFIAFVIFIINLKGDKVILIPMMFVFSLLCTFFNWIIYERKNNSK